MALEGTDTTVGQLGEPASSLGTGTLGTEEGDWAAIFVCNQRVWPQPCIQRPQPTFYGAKCHCKLGWGHNMFLRSDFHLPQNYGYHRNVSMFTFLCLFDSFSFSCPVSVFFCLVFFCLVFLMVIFVLCFILIFPSLFSFLFHDLDLYPFCFLLLIFLFSVINYLA